MLLGLSKRIVTFTLVPKTGRKKQQALISHGRAS